MPGMKTLLASFLVLGLAVAAVANPAPPAPTPPLQAGPVGDRSRICMMQDSMQPKAGIAQEYKGKTYYLCCPMCAQSFNADPEKFANAKDPVNGKTVDKATAPAYHVGSRAFFFSSQETLQTFAADPAKYLPGT